MSWRGEVPPPARTTSRRVALIDQPSTTSTPSPPAPAGPTVSTAPDSDPSGARPAAGGVAPACCDPGRRRRVGPPAPLADAWIAAGAKGIDPDATPGPAVASGSAGPRPVRIEIAAIGVAAPVDPAGKNGDGTLQVPADFARTSYYTGRPVPGDAGPAVIVGHVDGRRGPAVFYRLRDLRPGAEVRVHRADGSVVTFVVERSKQVPKKAFPTDEVYGPTPGPTLRLITCGGSFDHRSGHYRDNTIVFLRLKG